jgi:hypothetical protein
MRAEGRRRRSWERNGGSLLAPDGCELAAEDRVGETASDMGRIGRLRSQNSKTDGRDYRMAERQTTLALLISSRDTESKHACNLPVLKSLEIFFFPRCTRVCSRVRVANFPATLDASSFADQPATLADGWRKMRLAKSTKKPVKARPARTSERRLGGSASLHRCGPGTHHPEHSRVQFNPSRGA